MLFVLALAARAGGDSPPCDVRQCMRCLKRCWDSASHDVAALVNELRQELVYFTGASFDPRLPAEDSNLCGSTAETTQLLTAVRNIARAHRRSLGWGRVWGFGYHGQDHGWWVAWYLCPRGAAGASSMCRKPPPDGGHGAVIARCSNWWGVCSYDEDELELDAPTTGGLCTRPRRQAAPERAAAAGGGARGSAARAGTRGGHALRARRLDASTAAPAEPRGEDAADERRRRKQLKRILGRRPWECAAEQTTFRRSLNNSYLLDGGWLVYPQRKSRVSMVARYSRMQTLSYTVPVPPEKKPPQQPPGLRRRLARAAGAAGGSGGGAHGTPAGADDLGRPLYRLHENVTAYALATLEKDACFTGSTCRHKCAPGCTSRPRALHNNPCVELAQSALGPAGASAAPAGAAAQPSARR